MNISVFDTTLEKTNIWLRNVMAEMEGEDRQEAYLALRGVLHALRDRLQVNEAVQLGAQLPMLVRGFYYEGWRPSATPRRERHRGQFLEHVREAFPRDADIDSERVTRAVFAVLARRVSEGEIEDVTGMLPGELRDLWPEHSHDAMGHTHDHTRMTHHSHHGGQHMESAHDHDHSHAEMEHAPAGHKDAAGEHLHETHIHHHSHPAVH